MVRGVGGADGEVVPIRHLWAITDSRVPSGLLGCVKLTVPDVVVKSMTSVVSSSQSVKSQRGGLNVQVSHTEIAKIKKRTFPRRMIFGHQQPTLACDFDQVAGLSDERPVYAATFRSWSPLKNFSSIAVIGFTSDMPCLIPF
ncbi:hypothetical protein EVAR_55707_1 [Eumeta japonica]|uniref:Uncharacterized protein n=1 Tax=Eumeta variegata TaxID=151549 RepID=A0A4C1Z516_EUMVA|nr:hypothetical protein EVAR_55707_1 [Eumeta japonica]